MIRLVLPTHLYRLANTGREIELQVDGPVTINSVLDAWKRSIRCCRGRSATMSSKQRRPFIRFFICGEDWSFEPADALLPDDITSGRQAFLIVGAMAGG